LIQLPPLSLSTEQLLQRVKEGDCSGRKTHNHPAFFVALKRKHLPEICASTDIAQARAIPNEMSCFSI